jgi:hypothetical protein
MVGQRFHHSPGNRMSGTRFLASRIAHNGHKSALCYVYYRAETGSRRLIGEETMLRLMPGRIRPRCAAARA